jgi:hypothetical protein
MAGCGSHLWLIQLLPKLCNTPPPQHTPAHPSQRPSERDERQASVGKLSTCSFSVLRAPLMTVSVASLFS